MLLLGDKTMAARFGIDVETKLTLHPGLGCTPVVPRVVDPSLPQGLPVNLLRTASALPEADPAAAAVVDKLADLMLSPDEELAERRRLLERDLHRAEDARSSGKALRSGTQSVPASSLTVFGLGSGRTIHRLLCLRCAFILNRGRLRRKLG